jgi:hypothetical protein
MNAGTANQSTQQSDDGRSPKRSRRRPLHPEEGAFTRLQQSTQTQLGFINNLLITLAVGLLAFAVNSLVGSAEVKRLGWREWMLFAGLVILAFSVFSGLMLALNRLASHRITTRVARLKQLRERCKSQPQDYDLQRLGRQAIFFQTWARYSWSKITEKGEVHRAALGLAAEIPEKYKVMTRENPVAKKLGWSRRDKKQGRPSEPNAAAIKKATDSLVKALRSWVERADEGTWCWLSAQTWSFMIGALLLLTVPLTYF